MFHLAVNRFITFYVFNISAMIIKCKLRVFHTYVELAFVQK